VGLANDLGEALDAFSGAITAQSAQQEVPRGQMPTTAANGVNEGLLGLVYDVATAPVSYAKGKTDVPPIQSLGALQSQSEATE
jgi:hypothetical protein